MIKKLVPVILLFLGTSAGVAAGLYLRPAPAPNDAEQTEVTAVPAAEKLPLGDREYLKMNNQFVVPIVYNEHVQALVVLSLSLEVTAGQKDTIYAHEPKIRDSFLQVLFDHANVGGFDGTFTDANNLAPLRNALREVAQRDMGDIISDVLIVEIARQDY